MALRREIHRCKCLPSSSPFQRGHFRFSSPSFSPVSRRSRSMCAVRGFVIVVLEDQFGGPRVWLRVRVDRLLGSCSSVCLVRRTLRRETGLGRNRHPRRSLNAQWFAMHCRIPSSQWLPLQIYVQGRIPRRAWAGTATRDVLSMLNGSRCTAGHLQVSDCLCMSGFEVAYLVLGLFVTLHSSFYYP